MRSKRCAVQNQGITLNERHVCSPKLSLSGRFSPLDAYLLLLNVVIKYCQCSCILYCNKKPDEFFFSRIKIKI